MRAALGLALAFGGGALALYVLSGRVPLSGAPSAAASGGATQTASTQQVVAGAVTGGALQGTGIGQVIGGALLGGFFGGGGGTQ